MKQAITELAQAVNRLADAVQLLKEGKEEHSPQTPYKEKAKKQTTKTTTRTRERFVKPTIAEIAAYVSEHGYNIDAERFWNYYESKGWLIGNHVMRSWKSACVTWMKNEKSDPRFRNQNQSAEAQQDDRKKRQLAVIDQLLGRKEAK